jgi:hypothetical protein
MTRPVVYVRGVESVEVQATVGRTEFDVDDGTGATIHTQSRDYLITAIDLMLGGDVTLPKRGDVIREAQGTSVFVHEVVAPGDEPAWRYSDPYRHTLRVHTKQIDVEVTP